MNGMHAELFTYSLYHALSADMAKYIPLKLCRYAEVSDAETEPHFFIACTKNEVPLRFSVRFNQRRFVVGYENSGADIQENVANELRDLRFMEDDVMQDWHVDPEEVESWLLKLAASVASDELGEAAHV